MLIDVNEMIKRLSSKDDIMLELIDKKLTEYDDYFLKYLDKLHTNYKTVGKLKEVYDANTTRRSRNKH
jgi:hypothetical protein